MNANPAEPRIGFSLQVKTTAAAVAAASLFIFLLGAALVGREKRILQGQSSLQARILAEEAVSALGRERRPSSPQPGLLRMMSISRARRVTVTDAAGQTLLAAAAPEGGGLRETIAVALPSARHGPLRVSVGFATEAPEHAVSRAAASVTGLLLASIALIAGSFIIGLRRMVIGPISRLAQASSRIAGGDLTQRVRGLPQDEIGELADDFNAMLDRLQETQGFLQAANDKMVELLTRVEKQGDLQVRFENPSLVRCWEFKACGRRDCPAYGSADLRCWQMAGTYCGAAPSGVFALKIRDCEDCGVYRTATADIVLRVGETFNNMMFVLETKTRELAQAQEELRAANVTLERTVRERTKELTAANQELEAFTYSASHDLRAPLRWIDGFGTLLETECAGSLDARGREYLRRMHDACSRMSGIVEDLLRLSHITRCSLRRRTVDLSAALREIVSRLREAEPGRRVEFVMPPERIAVSADPGLVGAALENLLGNAWKFTGKTAAPRVEFGTCGEGTGRTYYIRDNGVGFAMARADCLFRPFQRLHAHSDFPGSGIGLSITQRIIERHGGTIWAQAAEGAGAAFYFTLPD